MRDRKKTSNLSPALQKAHAARKKVGKQKRKPTSHTINTKDEGSKVIEKYTRSIAIAAHCTECMGFGEVHPNDCTSINCALFPFRKKTTIAYYSDDD